MNDKGVIIILVGLLLVLLGILIFMISRFYHVKRKLAYMEQTLEDVQIGNGNRRILVGSHDAMAPLAYRLNEIVYAYEDKLRSLKKADETNKQLMTSLSHDVRTPLTTLIGYLDAVHSDIVKDCEREEYIEVARHKAYDLKNYIDVLFDWFRLNSNEFTLSIESVEIAEITRNILKDWVPIFREQGMDFEIEIPEKRIMVKLDIDGYSRVVNNLVQNVVAHSKASQIKITITADATDIWLSVADNGVGIEKEDLQHIFERLYKCDKGRSEKGSGLGLSIVDQMVDRMGGKISAKSEVGKYTAFTVELPRI